MSKIKTSLKEPTIDNRLLDDRGPTGELLARVAIERGDTGTIRIVRQSPMERAIARGIITEQHGNAAAKFYGLWYNAGCVAIHTNWKSELAPQGKREITHKQAINLLQLRQAIDYIHEKMDHCGQSVDALRLLHMVVCQEISFEDAGLVVWPHRGVSKALSLAVDRVRSALRVLSIKWGIGNKA